LRALLSIKNFSPLVLFAVAINNKSSLLLSANKNDTNNDKANIAFFISNLPQLISLDIRDNKIIQKKESKLNFLDIIQICSYIDQIVKYINQFLKYMLPRVKILAHLYMGTSKTIVIKSYAIRSKKDNNIIINFTFDFMLHP
jgi:hypothetical protein